MARNGVYVETDAEPGQKNAVLRIQTEVENKRLAPETVLVEQTVLDAGGNAVARTAEEFTAAVSALPWQICGKGPARSGFLL